MEFDLDLAVSNLVDVIDQHEMASSTATSYRNCWQAFERWCTENELAAVPASPRTVQLYLIVLTNPWIDDRGEIHLTYRATNTGVPLAAISWKHRKTGHPSPVATEEVRALSQLLARAKQPPSKKARPLLLEHIDLIAASPPDIPTLERAWTFLLLGMFGAFRATELVSIRREHVQVSGDGLRVFVPRSKGDPYGQGEWVAIARRREVCPVAQLERWMAALDESQPWLFPSTQSRSGHLTVAALRSDINAICDGVLEGGPHFTTHSLRRGFCTSAARAGNSLLSISLKARHKSCGTTLGYIESRPGQAVEVVAKALAS